MATRHARIGVTKDPELAAALDATRELMSPADARSEAGHVRRLALLGARALAGRHGVGEVLRARARVLDVPGVRPATRDLLELPWLEDQTVDASERASRDLDWVRGE